MSVLECLKWHNFVQIGDDTALTTEGKNGIPRFAGDATKLAEYQFRVRLRQVREKTISEEEKKKIGPLGLRLVDGLSGPALQVVRDLPIEKLAEENGPTFLLHALQTALQPRSNQEARELYQAGAQAGGILSRQNGESIASYVLRRRTWYTMMTDLDTNLKLPEQILAEQTLQNAGISPDHQLLIRTALGGQMNMTKLCEELVAQHARIHEREHRGKSYGKPSAYKGMKGYGKKSSWRAYHVESEEGGQDWDNASQSLGGYEDLDEQSYYAYETEEIYMDETDVVYEAFTALVDNGMDEEDQESLDYAAEILQAEADVYFARQSASDGQKGLAWGGSRNFQVQGQLSFEEKKAKLQQVKNRTTCKRCGQYGHWQNDPVCPKGVRKGKGKSKKSSSMSSTSTTSSAKGKSGKPGGKGDKPRTVYFTINEYEDYNHGQGHFGYMVVKESMNAVPPPQVLQQGIVLPASTAEEGGAGEKVTAEELLEKMIAEADRRQGRKRLKGPEEEEVDLSEDEDPTQDEMVAYLRNSGRVQHLDRYLELADRNTKEYEDVYQERWSEFVPGHPLYLESDKKNIKRWIIKAKLGLPVLPLEDQQRPAPPQSSQAAASPSTATTLSLTTPATSSAESGQVCQHLRTTKQGSNAYVKMVKCRDCGAVLQHEKEVRTAPMEVKSSKDCDHFNKDFRGTTGKTWKWKCKDCGHQESGYKKEGQRGAEAAAQGSSSKGGYQGPEDKKIGATAVDRSGGVDQVMDLMMATIEVQKELGNEVGFHQMDVIYQHCKDYIARKTGSSTSTTFMATSSSTTTKPARGGSRAEPEQGEPPERWRHRIMDTGVHKGKTFMDIFEKDKTYVKSMIGKHTGGSLTNQCLRDFAVFAKSETEKRTGKVAFMSQHVSMELDQEELVLAILDTGCNNTCHGSGWMQRFQEYMGVQLQEEPADGRFNGVGGRVEVACKRTIPMNMETVDDDYVPGLISSIELKDSEAPLLLSIWAQKALGLVIDVEANTAYSKKLDKELKLVQFKGLPAIKLLPGVKESDSIALVSTSINLEELDGIADEESQERMEEEEEAGQEGGEQVCEEEAGFEKHLPIQDEEIKILNRGKKKELSERLQDMEKEDSALWSTLGTTVRRPKRLLPRGCKTFLLEIFAGAATLSCLAAQMGLTISNPVDLSFYPEDDLLKKENRDRLSRQIEQEDPFLVTLAPVCGPWSMWQNYNMTRGEEIEEKIWKERKEWYPVICWIMDLVKSRLQKGREVLVENPWGSKLWSLKCVEKLMNSNPINLYTGEPLEIQRIDQCMYGLVDQATGYPHEKGTGLMLSSRAMKRHLQQRCDHSHWHLPLEGGKTKKAQKWPVELCQAMLDGALEEMRHHVIGTAFPAEAEIEEKEEKGPLDSIQDSRDIAEEGPAKRRKVDHEEIHREEKSQEAEIVDKEDEQLCQHERRRKEKWLRLPKEKRIAVRRLHAMMGHCSTAAMTRMLKASMVEKEVLDALPHFRCQVCAETKTEEKPRVVRATRPGSQNKFNYEIAVDCFEIHDADGHRHTILSVVDMATHYHLAARVCSGGVPSSRICAETLNNIWLIPFGAPSNFVCDQGVHNRGRVQALLQAHGTAIRRVGVRAPFQLGTGERHGGMLKAIMCKAVHDRQMNGADMISALCSEACRTKNTLVNHGGYSPMQWVLGHLPDDLTSLLSHQGEDHLGVHQNVVNQEEDNQQEAFMKQLLVRQWAKEAFIQVDTSQKIRKAMLRRTTPMRGPYRTGDLVCFAKKGQWYGPARVLGYEGASSMWVVHSGVTILIAEVACRPATTEEAMKKHVLELRPGRKRYRDIVAEDPEEDYIPFSEDGDFARMLRPRTEGQAPFVDVSTGGSMSQPGGQPYPAGGDPTSGMAANPGGEEELSSPMEDIFGPVEEEEQADPIVPPGLEDLLQDSDMQSSMSGQPQPENEESPEMSENHTGSMTTEVTSAPMSETQSIPAPVEGELQQDDQMPEAETPLTQALRQGPDRLDGHPRANLVVSSEDEKLAFLVTRQEKKVEKKVKKYQRKNKKTGAGREIVYEKSPEDVQEKLIETRKKEWANWQKYSDGTWITEEELKDLQRRDPKVRVIPTRWVEVNKAELGEEAVLKSRLVVRGDLEDASKMRTDSPTCSQLLMSLTMVLSACRDVDVWAGDISAAFLQGSKLDRTLVLSQPRGGIPGETPGKFYMVSSTIYGTKDAPRGWFKNLHNSLVKEGLRPVPHEAAAYVLNGKNGEIEGLVVVHVDDLLWTGGRVIESKMKGVCELYKFGKVERNKFRYCGREVCKDSAGIHITCPSLIDRVKPVTLTAEQRKMKSEGVTEAVRGQLRSVIGSLAWLARVCRPDLAYAVSKLQSCVHHANYEDVMFANGIVNIARKTKEVGLHYPLKAFKFEEAMVVGIQDASFSNDSAVQSSGKKLGNRSQSGRLLCLADNNFREEQKGNLLLLDWHSTTLKRVCRSTMQAETLSLMSGSEESEHLRLVLHGLRQRHDRRDRKWLVEAQDEICLDWYTDCRSLEEHVNQPGLHTVGDKRLAIDLSAIRQVTWRLHGEEYGDPLLTDRISPAATTRLLWTSTDRMPADCLTKAMKPGALVSVMDGAKCDLTPTKEQGCEIQD